MNYIYRILQKHIEHALARDKSILLLGARQTGKTTLIKQIKADFFVSLIQPGVRLRYERNPSFLTGEIEALAEKIPNRQALVIIDEIQKIPHLLDAVQDLIDRKIAQFILTGSSARKLRTSQHINLLPGRVVYLHLDPLTLAELSAQKTKKIDLNNLLLFGSLPGITLVEKSEDRELDLASYTTIYLEEEIRLEALVRNIGTFSHFLSLAAAESGNIVNFHKLSQEIGVAHTTIAAYYQILEDCLITERVEPLVFTKMRRKLIKSAKYIFFDLGVRRLCAGEGTELPKEYMGRLFEQWVGLELIRASRLSEKKIKFYFWRDSSGPEVDWILEKNGHFYPIEVKWTENPNLKDIKYLQLFKKEYSQTACCYLVCRIPQKIKLAENIYALPWQDLDEII